MPANIAASPELFLTLLKSFSIAFATLSALGLGIWTASKWYAAPPATVLESGILLPEPRVIASFELTDQDGGDFSNDRLLNRWSLLFVGFTHCPDVCPTTLALLKLLEQRLQTGNRSLNAVFVSVDPQRDTPQRLQSYVRYFSPSLTGVTGAPAELDRLCASLGIAYLKVPGATATDYTMDHSAALVLVNPKGEVAGYFQAPHKIESLAADLARVIPLNS